MPGRDWIAAAGVLWPLLTKAAAQRQTVTYSDLAPAISTNPLSVGYALGPIQDHCLRESLPPLTSLVVHKEDQLPGSGFIAGRPGELAADQEHVFAFDWTGVPNPFAPPVRTYLLTWNPKKYPWANLQESLAAFDREGFLEGNWSTGGTKSIEPNDRLFLLRQGVEPRGIMASGYAVSEVYEDEPFEGADGEVSRYVDVRFDALLDPEGEGVLPLTILEQGVTAEQNWHPMASGTQVHSAVVAAELERLWAEHLDAVGVVAGTPADVTGTGDTEGTPRQVTGIAYERNPEARRRCIDHHGCVCSVCGFDFERFYGEVGEGFIHVHHLLPLSDVRQEHEVDPVKDLRPVCANCHAMLHREKPVLGIEQLAVRVAYHRGRGRPPEFPAAAARPSRCPVCGSTRVARILWGLLVPDRELQLAMAAGEVIPGGCRVSDDDPIWQCTECGASFGRRDR